MPWRKVRRSCRPYSATLRAATSSASDETSTASTCATGKASAARMARQPDPVHMSRARSTCSGSRTQGASPSSSSSAIGERGTITRRSTWNRWPRSQASPVR
ncbi:Uncharacterised protein [Bordetella pertussis]|nr:Uncharacterised protein [Bordetella pertussis]CFW34497.1 Uncharacterised protein [Bordetella pertussis]